MHIQEHIPLSLIIIGQLPQTPAPMFKTIDVFTGGLALLAFIMALYALAAREQKTPYITTSVYSTALIVLGAIIISSLSKILNTKNVQLADTLSVVSTVLLGIGILNVFYRVWQLQNRNLNFRDDHLIKNLKLIRWAKSKLRSIKNLPTYAHDPEGIGESLIHDIKESLEGCGSVTLPQIDITFKRYQNIEYEMSTSAACRVSNLTEADQLLSKLTVSFLKHECWVQYTTCARHPIEFILQLKKTWENTHQGKSWQQVVKGIIAVDAYSSHFGYTDTIHDEFTKRLKRIGVECITAKASYAGMHTAAARAFNTVKGRAENQSKPPVRKPTLAIYEGANALVELESAEQYRIFIRHLLPSERLWGGMFTFLVESAISEQDLSLLRTYADIFIDLAPDQGNQTSKVPRRSMPEGESPK